MNSLSKQRILIADHDQTFLDQLTDRLLKMKMEVDFAENGKTAMKLAETESYDLIIAEIAMPVFNGLEILRKAKSKNPDTPVLIMTYELTQDWADQAMREGAYKYLQRPLDDIRKFDRAVKEGLDLAPKKQAMPASESSFTEDVFAALPQTETRTPFGEEHVPVEMAQTPVIESPTPPFKAASKLVDLPDPLLERAPWELLHEESKTLPEGMIELNGDGQIVSCSAPARNWLMLEANCIEKPIKKIIRTLGKRSVPEHLRVQIVDRHVHLNTKTINDRTGATRYILVIRESRVGFNKPDPSTAVRVPLNQAAARASSPEKNAFSSSLKQYRADPEDQGFSPIGFFDQMKSTVKEEVEKLKEQNPFELFGSKPEEADPDMVFTMSRRISDVSRGRRTSF